METNPGERFSSALVDAAPDALIAVEPSGNILFWSSGATLCFGHDVESAAGSDLFDLIGTKASQQDLRAVLAEAMSAGSATFEGPACKRDRTEIGIEVIVRKIAANPPWLAFCARDITERRHLVREVFEQNWRLETALGNLRRAQQTLITNERLALVGQLTASVCHDLRNPLSVIRNGVHFMAKRMDAAGLLADEKTSTLLGLVQRELEASHRMLEEMRLRAREQPLESVACNLDALVADAVSVVDTPDHVALVNDASSAPNVTLDPSLFRRCLVNVIQNAVEAIPQDREGTVRVTTKQHANEVVVEVIDDGPGIPSDLLTKLTEPLYTTKATGTGLGLAIVSNIMERHNGKLEIESAVGSGTTVRLRLPAARTGLQSGGTHA